MLEEINDKPLHYPVVAPVVEQLAPMRQVSAAGQICAAAAADAEPEGSPQASKQSIGQIGPKAPGWTRRVRIGSSAPGRTPCSSRVTALEKAIGSFATVQQTM